MSVKLTDENGKRDRAGLFLPGCRPGPGRPKGSKNLFNMTMKEALEAAFWQAGGIDWLVRLAREEPRAFASLLARLLPKEVDASVTVTEHAPPDRIEIVIVDHNPETGDEIH